ncbi:phosphatidylserine decarboxylase [Halobacillus sp. B29]|uniref:phosphatidylserine decarboxylase n=1 Tax=Halobacillus sp. B29 TaxID=3457432 RepID=UPI003FCEE192
MWGFSVYLSPQDYPRIHSPGEAVVTKQYELGGKSISVNKWGLFQRSILYIILNRSVEFNIYFIRQRLSNPNKGFAL